MINTEKRTADTLKYDIPRRELSMKESNERAMINFEKQQIVTPGPAQTENNSLSRRPNPGQGPKLSRSLNR